MTVYKFLHTKLAYTGLTLILLGSSLAGCNSPSGYHSQLSQELSRNVRYDSLFFGITLGMTKKDFYSTCWELNKQGVFHQGTRNTTVLYKVEDLGPQIDMDFYPNFTDEKIIEMPVYFKYAGWAPWNKHLSADSLQLHLIPLLEQWYGPGFMPIRLANQPAAYVKIDGNRRILLTIEDEINVKALFSDMTMVEDQLKPL